METTPVKSRFFSHHDEVLLIGHARPLNPWRGRAIFLGKVLVYGYIILVFLYHLFAPVLRLFGVDAPYLPKWVFENTLGFTIWYFVLKILFAWSARKLERISSLPGASMPLQIPMTDQLRMLFPAGLGLVQIGFYPSSYTAFREWEQQQSEQQASEGRTVEGQSQQKTSSQLIATEKALSIKEEETRNSAKEISSEMQRVQAEVIRIEILLFERLTLVLVDSLGRRLSFTFPKRKTQRYIALIAYLATYGECTRDDLKLRLYSRLYAKDNSFDHDKQRILKTIQEVASAYGMILKPTLFENSRESLWSLGTFCHRDNNIQEQLEHYHAAVLAMQTGQRPLDLEELRTIGENAMKFHGKGYLGEYDFKKAWWTWAKKPFLHYRKIVLTIVDELAEQEYQAGRQVQKESERNQHLQQAAEHYTWSMETAMHSVPDTRLADLACSRAISIYKRDLKNTKAAEKVRKAYERLRKSQHVEVDEDEV